MDYHEMPMDQREKPMDQREKQLRLKMALAATPELREQYEQELATHLAGEEPPLATPIRPSASRHKNRGWKVTGVLALVLGLGAVAEYYYQRAPDAPWRTPYLQERLNNPQAKAPLQGCYQARELRRVLTSEQMASFVQSAFKNGFYELDAATYCFNNGKISIVKHGKAIK